MMEELQAKHRKELKDLQARIAQKKKNASKKTRKGVNDECDALEKETGERQVAEIAALNGKHTEEEAHEENLEDGVTNGTAALSLEEETMNKVTSRPLVQHGPQSGAGDSSESQQQGFYKKPNRARARMERRKAEQEALFNQASHEASNLPDLKAAERERMVAAFRSRGLVEKEIRADGHCLYSAFADQMDVHGEALGTAPIEEPNILRSLSHGFRRKSEPEQQAKLEEYKVVRKAAAEYIEAHPDDFAPFLEEPLPEYIRKVRDTGEWGGQLELLALARRYGVQINVLQGDGRVEEIFPDQQDEDVKKLWLAYYRHGFGLGEHYNSLRTGG